MGVYVITVEAYGFETSVWGLPENVFHETKFARFCNHPMRLSLEYGTKDNSQCHIDIV
jgi:hypothetical protein